MTTESARYAWIDDPEHGRTLRLEGNWTLPHLSALPGAPRDVADRPRRIDGGALQALDTAGALLLIRRWLGPPPWPTELALRPPDRALLELVAAHDPVDRRSRRTGFGLTRLAERVGLGLEALSRDAFLLLAFTGRVVDVLYRILRGHQRLRFTAAVHHMERTGLDAVPIVALLCFMVGAVVAFLGATVLSDFGAAVYTVELVAYSFLREFGVLLAAILLAGRSGSAFTAEIGMMRAREEVDAIRALGLDPIELLVIPRLIALLVMLPVLAFIGVLSGFVGGALVGAAELNISPTIFIARLHEASELRHFGVGLVKAPVFALVIALVGCLEGFKVRGSAESVGRHTTSAVVQAIFLVILLDALFAILFMELDW